MPGEPDNLPLGGTDNAHSLSLDDATNLDFGDPVEDNEEAVDEQQSNDEPVEATDEVDQETDEPANDEPADDDAEQGDDDPEAAEISDDILVPMQDGKPLPLKEIKAGYMRQADYSRKTMDLGNKRTALEALSNRVTNSVNAIAELLTSTVPKRPDDALALTDPQRHYKEMTLHNSAMAKVAEVIAKANEPKEALNTLTAEQRKETLAVENAKLAEAFPQTTTAEGRKKFFETAAGVARELGYSDEEIGQATDHRMFALAHYARIGMQAEAARTKAKAKIVNVPPVAPNKRQPGTAANGARKNQDAMKRLARTGSIHDAMDIDF